LLRGLLRSKRLAGAIVYGGYKEPYQANARWLAGMREGMQYYAFFPEHGEPRAWNFLYPHLIAAQRMSCIADTQWGGASIAHTVARHLEEQGLGASRVGLVGVHHGQGITLPMDHYLIWRDELPDLELVDITQDVERLAVVRSPEELTFYQQGAEYTDGTMEGLIRATKAGASEVSLYGRMVVAAYEQGGEVDLALLGSTAMAQPDMAYPRHTPSERVLGRGDVLLNEISVHYGGCSGQLAVPISVGQPSSEYRDLYQIARSTFENIQRILRPGATQDDVAAACRPITDAGLTALAPVIHGWPDPPRYPYLSLSTAPEAERGDPFVLEENMLVVIQPNPATADLRRGVHLGALHVVTREGGRNLQRHPLDFVVVEGD
jgi:Xaa-Pro aminopeptidase